MNRTRTEQRLYDILRKTPGMVVPTKELLATLYKYKASSLHTHLKKLRKTLPQKTVIRSVKGYGYVLIKK